MSDDVRRIVYGTLIGFLVVVGSWLGFIYISACGFTLSCNQAAPLVIRTPMATLNPSHEVKQVQQQSPEQFNACYVSAADLIGAWVTAGAPENGTFDFQDVNGDPCQGTFKDDLQHLFMENELWYPGAIGCTSCHNAELTAESGGLDLSSYQGMTSGTNRSYAGAKGTDILGGGNWDSSLLHDVLLVHGFDVKGHSKDAPPLAPIFIYAGQHVAPTTATAAPTATPQPTATSETTTTTTATP
jgi:hypothetical protein